MSENEIQRRYRLEAERKRAEQGQAPEVSMEELAARAMARLGASASQPDSASEPKPVKSSTLGVYGEDDEKLIKEETMAALENAGAIAAGAGRALMEKAKVAAALAQEKARQAQERATAAAAEMAASREERVRLRFVKAAEASLAQVNISERLPVEPVAEVQAPKQPKAVEHIAELLPKAWVVKEEKSKRPWGLWIASGLVLVVLASAGVWLLRSKSSEPVPEPTPMVEATSPEPRVVEPEPAQVEAIDVEPMPAPVAAQPGIAQPEPTISEIPAPPRKKAADPVMPPVAVKTVARPVQPKPAATVPVIKPAPKPSAPKPEPRKDWQEQGMQDLDALEKKLGG